MITAVKVAKFSQVLSCMVVGMAFVSPAFAYDPDGPCCHGDGPPRWYVALSGSAVFLADTQINSSSPVFLDDKQTYNIGYAMSGAVGYKLFSGVRAELEITERESRVKKDPYAQGVIPAGSYTAQTSTALMANAYIDLHNKTSFTPYFGGGLGAAYVKNPDFYVFNGQSTGKLEDFVPAYQFMTGVNYDFNTSFAPVELFIGYRYFATEDIKVKSSLAAAPSTFTFPNKTNNFELGGRVYF